MKNIDIVTIVNAYQNTDGTLTLPAKIAWTRRVNFRKLIEAKSIIDEALQDIQKEYADDTHSEESEEGRVVKPQYRAGFAKAQADVLTQETDVDIKKVTIEELGDITLTDKQMDTIAFMIEE